MPNRMIKESICTSETLAQLTAEEERFFYRLLVNADDFGRFDGRPAVVLAACFPLQLDRVRVDDVEAWLQKLASVDLIRFYEVGGRRYLYFPTWDKHQRKRAQHSKYPAPPSDDRHVTVTCPSRDGHATDTCCSRNEKRESRNEKRETTDETRARAREADSVAVRPSVGQSIGLPVDAAEPSPDMAAIARHYGERIGMLGPSIFADLGDWHDRGMDAEVIMAAIDRTAEARSEGRIRGSPDSYLRGVLRQMYNDGIRTADDLRARGRADPRSPDYDPVSVILERAAEWDKQYQGGVGGDS